MVSAIGSFFGSSASQQKDIGLEEPQTETKAQVDHSHENTQAVAKDGSWFSPEFVDSAKRSLSFACLGAVVRKRDQVLKPDSDSYMATKLVIYLTTEIATLLLIPVSLIEGIFRFAISSMAYPFALMGLIDTGAGSFYHTLVDNHAIAFGTALYSAQAVVANLNPKQQLAPNVETIELHYPVISKLFS